MDSFRADNSNPIRSEKINNSLGQNNNVQDRLSNQLLKYRQQYAQLREKQDTFRDSDSNNPSDESLKIRMEIVSEKIRNINRLLGDNNSPQADFWR